MTSRPISRCALNADETSDALPAIRLLAPVLAWSRNDRLRTVRWQSRKLTMFKMSSRDELNQKLRALEMEFEREMRARGFDPAQVENVALPSHLAALYAEREKIKGQIEESEGKADD